MILFDKILFVDADDTARALMAEAVMNHSDLIQETRIESRGLVVLFPAPPNQKAEAILANYGMTVSGHEARQLTAEDLNGQVLVLVMEEAQKARVKEINPAVRNLYTISEYAGFTGDIMPLIGEELPAYGKCFELLRGLVGIICAKLNED